MLKKYTRNDDREVLEDSYTSIANKYLALPIPTIDGIRTILTELSSTVPAVNLSATVRRAQDCAGDRSERVCQTALREVGARTGVFNQRRLHLRNRQSFGVQFLEGTSGIGISLRRVIVSLANATKG